MYSIAFHVLNDHQLAQDAVQMSFVKIIDTMKIINDVECNKTKAFLVIICRNISINMYKKRKRNNPITIEEIEDSLPDHTCNLDDQMINFERLSALKEKIKMLYEPYADIITLKYIFDYSEKEIAKILDISEQNARVRLHRAKNSLIKLIGADEGDEVV